MKQLCFEYRDDPGNEAIVSLYQTGFDQFTVQYGKQVDSDLNYHEAARALGRALMHNAACEGSLDSRAECEVNNGDTEPYFANTR